MGRPIVLSNGQLFVGLDEHGLVHDFYFPYVGLENLTNARSIQHKIGIWVDGKFSWTDDGSWDTKLELETDALVGRATLQSKKLQLTIQTTDFVDISKNALIRRFLITNDAKTDREVRLFTHQVFQISRAGRADTAIYVPDEHYIFDYKGRYCLLIGGKLADGSSFDQYAVGNYGIEGKVGTYLDSEDGELSNNAVEHGGVDSVIRFSTHLEASKHTTIDYWVIAASSQNDVQTIHKTFKQHDIGERLAKSRHGWNAWVNDGQTLPDYHTDSLKHSMMIVRAHCDERGSVLASGDSSIFNYGRDYYCYCWPRDAVYALTPLMRLGHFDEAKKFLKFARDTRHKDGYLMHKYQPDRAVGSTWHPLVHGRNQELAIQEDETACVLFMIDQYLTASHDRHFVESLFHTFVAPCADFLCRFVDETTGLPHASYDLWEEKFSTSTYTVCTVIAGLEAASRLAEEFDHPEDEHKWETMAAKIRDNLVKLYHPDGYFRKGFLLLDDGQLQYDDTIDISNLYGPLVFAGLPQDDERITNTAKRVEERLLNTSPSGGVLRYENDSYFKTKPQFSGNPWIVCSLWLAEYYLRVGKTDQATKLLDWSFSKELSTGVLSEQFDPETGAPLGVTPLVWSQAQLINTILDYSQANDTN